MRPCELWRRVFFIVSEFSIEIMGARIAGKVISAKASVACRFLWFLFFPSILAASAPPVFPSGTATTQFNLNSHDVQLIHVWRMHDGDDPEWRQPGFDDSGWPAGSPNQLPHFQAGVHWLRARVVLTGTQSPFDVLVFRSSKLPVAFEVYWDGVRVGENGRMGRREEDEIPGQVSFMTKLPRELTPPGPHVLSIRFSNFHKKLRPRKFWAVVSYHADWIQMRAKDIQLQYLWLGIYLTSTFLSLALFLGGGRHRAFLVFAIFSFLLSLWLALNPLLEMFSMNILTFNVLNGLGYLALFCAEVLLNVFFIYHFDSPRKRIHIPVLVMLPLLIEMLNIRHLFGVEWRGTVMMAYSIGLVAYAWKQRKAGSAIALFGVLASTLPALYGNFAAIVRILPRLDPRIELALSFLFIPSIILSISRQIREQNRLNEATRVHALRLEAELLKTHIHPHFIRNTLHSVKSWIREDPAKAEKLIQTLADEFQLIHSASSKSLIPLADEIRLCECHLKIMGYRRDVHFTLTAENIPADQEIPPLVFHTLIENGLTHALRPRENGRFWLRYEKIGDEDVYTLQNDGSRLRDIDRERPEIKEGLGFKYVKARLEESYPGRWTIEYGIDRNFWKVMIRIKREVS